MEENIKDNRNLITALIALIILIVVAVFYWDRQKQRDFQQTQAEMQGNLLEEWGPQAQQKVQAALQGQPVAFSKAVSYKNIVSRIAPSVVSINVSSGFFNQGGPAVQSQPVAQNRPADQSQEAARSAQYVWRGSMGDWGAGSYWLCPKCCTSVPCRRGISAYSVGSPVNCPSCGIGMIHGCQPWACPLLAQAQQPQAQNQPVDQSQEASGLGQYVWGGRMGGWGLGPGGYLVCPNCATRVPHQRSAPVYTVSCPSCGKQMIREGTPWVYPIGQQVAQAQQDKQFQALGRGGSGVIVNSRGYVLTNHHVVHGARNITVTLSWGQATKTYPAQLVDEAPDVDFAILKIVANGNEQFTPASIGNSSEVSVGDEVLAVGSPFGLQQTVTFGIVSNTQRRLTVGKKTFNNFIQTDAPINPGSSGGPLVNVKGEVIGINTAIYSPTQAFSGIGFASPIDPAIAAFPEFIETTSNVAGVLRRNIPNWARGPALKQVARGPQIQQGLKQNPSDARLRQGATVQSRPWLGIRVRAVDKEIRTFVGLPMARGVLVMEVFDNSPCRAAGLQRGDVIIRADDRSVRDEAMLEALLAKKKVGDSMKLTIYRDGKKIRLSPRLSVSPTGLRASPAAIWPEAPEWPEPQGAVLKGQALALAQQPFNPQNIRPPGLTGVLQGGEVETGSIEALGMELGELSPELALVYGVPKGVTGLHVVESATPATAAGLLANDVIEAVNGQRVETIADFIKVMNKADLKRGISLNVYRQGQRFNLTIRS
ncbi:MAG: trypsin-like peptidase domain-containing protein [Planctomycetota bacterium]|jgi:S1-C subfamily serine protease